MRQRDKIAAGRPTSFTWLRKSYRNTAIGKFVHQLPETLQEPAFMFIQYSYAVVTMLPCPFWFYHGRLSAMFIAVVGWWSVYNGATYYSGYPSLSRPSAALTRGIAAVDVFGKRFQKELEQFKKDAAKWQAAAAEAQQAGQDGLLVAVAATATAVGGGSEMKARNALDS